MEKRITYVGLDVHKRSISICGLVPGRERPVEWRAETTPEAVRKLARAILKIASPGGVRACYEAGPSGFELQRKLEAAGIACDVIAPSLIPRKPGDRIKTDRRDARDLAEQFEGGRLTVVVPPTVEEEAVRDLVRARDAARRERATARHRLQKFLDRRSICYFGKAWTQRFEYFLDTLKLEQPVDQFSFESYRLAVQQADGRIAELDRKIGEIAATEPYVAVVGRLRTLRGIDTLSAMVLVTELFGIERFQKPRSLMKFLGLIPGEDSSGPRVRRGPITKTGNGRVRRILIEAAHHQRRPYRVSIALRKRREGQPAWALAVADRAGQRLHHRFHRLALKEKPTAKIVAAVAREMVGFVWSLMQDRPEAIGLSQRSEASAPPRKKSSAKGRRDPAPARKRSGREV